MHLGVAVKTPQYEGIWAHEDDEQGRGVFQEVDGAEEMAVTYASEAGGVMLKLRKERGGENEPQLWAVADDSTMVVKLTGQDGGVMKIASVAAIIIEPQEPKAPAFIEGPNGATPEPSP